MTIYDKVNVPRSVRKVSFLVTRNEQDEIVALSLNMDDNPYRHYSPNVNWNISIMFPQLPRQPLYTGIF